MKKDFLSISELTQEEIIQLFEKTDHLKSLLEKGEIYHPLQQKTLAMIFRKPSTRTRISFEVAMYQLGGRAIFLPSSEMQLQRGESIEDTGKVLSRYVAGIVIRTFDQNEVARLAEAATVPVINGLTDLLHPCQALSDYYTLWERGKELEGLKLAYLGDGNNVCNSLVLGAAKLGVHIAIATPPGYEPDKEIIEKAAASGKITLLKDPLEAAKDASVLYTDVWTSMGKEEERESRGRMFKPYQLNAAMLRQARKDVLVMHCLPAHRGEEITPEVMDSEHSIVFEQAEMRLHFQKALLTELLT
ncbi:ornithine carbamoyltransferase [Candidatus Aerophobetes bacterium]|uniref:Ornithine carbamoyltransferase n=1 Tax=Aerophobetes bacterium TaxID=2030807 RepID=A0A523W1Y1_UNCAE|nr:MAG: ornithine carbamoyltransferase [Candidatus Aerophobetes bacterium]